mmetsp:Transcript_21103/g.35956  ORF Transcript_21103/g.35956 Transcript_21103/m.35956 type:complete len:83 (+) Transcript_21103:85-333(+)
MDMDSDRQQKRKQANRDSARRSKQRKKLQDLELVGKADVLKAQSESLTRQLSAAHNRHKQQQELHVHLKAQLSALGVQLPDS